MNEGYRWKKKLFSKQGRALLEKLSLAPWASRRRQELSYDPVLPNSPGTGTNTELGCVLSRVFQEAGLPAPSTRTVTLQGAEQWMPDCLHSLRPQMTQLNLSLEPLGDFETLFERLQAEVKAFKTTTPLPDLVSAWVRKPAN